MIKTIIVDSIVLISWSEIAVSIESMIALSLFEKPFHYLIHSLRILMVMWFVCHYLPTFVFVY